MAAIYIELEQYDKDHKYLEKGKDLFYTPAQEYSYYTKSAKYYLALNNQTKVLENLQQTKRVVDSDKEVRKQLNEYYNVLVAYYSTIRPRL